MNYTAEAIGTINESQLFLLLLIIDIWVRATLMERQNLISQQYLVDLHCVDATSNKLIIIYHPQ
eukprot:2479511-Ditylum_brightwellii.AAC.1